jgi:CRP/FNR family transcriptional regulator, cyclic AMP receptor protein
MQPRKPSNGAAKTVPAFNAQAFLDSTGVAKTITEYARGETIFTQGEACKHVLYIQTGGVKLSVLSKTGREAVVAMLGPGEFFGEGCLAGQPLRMGTATAITPSVILLIDKGKMVQLLHKQHAMSDRFISHMLARNTRIEEDLIDQLFNSSEKRLARTLLLLARYGKRDKPVRVVPKIFTGNTSGDDRHDALACEFFPEQIQEAGLHRLQRREPAQSQQLAAERRPARLRILRDLSPSLVWC